MPEVPAFTDEGLQPLHNKSSACHRELIDCSVKDSPPVLREIKLNNSAATSSLKRKRPLTIQIPQLSEQEEMPELDSCRDGAVPDEGTGFEASGCSVFCKRGRKKRIMEDTYNIVLNLQGDVKKGFFGVYDGHGGCKAAKFVAEHLHGNILLALKTCEGEVGKEKAVRAGYLKTNEEFLKQEQSSGACCVTALIIQGNIVVSNLGDCRAVLCRGGMAEALTTDHKAEREDERIRIEEKGGYVDLHHGAWRIQGTLAVSRSIGDVQLKQWVLADPDTRILPLSSDMDFLILASDGLWDKVSNQEAIDITIRSCFASKCSGLGGSYRWDDGFGNENSPPTKVRRISINVQHKARTRNRCPSQDSSNRSRLASSNLMVACKELVRIAVKRGSLDDITVMIIDLKFFNNS